MSDGTGFNWTKRWTAFSATLARIGGRVRSSTNGRSLPLHVVKKTAKGRVYYYYGTGALNLAGKPILKRLPDVGDIGFGAALASCNAVRTRRVSPAPLLTLPRLIDLYEKSPAYRDKAEATRKVYGIYLRVIADNLNTAPVDQVEQRDVVALMDSMADRPAAANMMVRTLGALYAWARDRGHVAKGCDPVGEVPLFKGGEHEPWPDELIERALKSDDARVQLATALLYFTAQRIGDVCAMRWPDIRGGVLFLRQQKTKTELEVPIHERLARILDQTPRVGLFILCRPDGLPYKPVTVRVALQEFAAARGFKVVPHGLRKSAVNALLEAGCSAAETGAISGQSLQVIEHYAKRRKVGRLASAAMLRWQAKA